MRFVQPSINKRMVQATVNPIDPAVGEADEKWVLQPVVPREWSLTGKIVEVRPSPHLCEEQRCREDSHDGHRGKTLFDFLLELVWKVSGVL
jgi:hypothetical protein